MNKVLWTLCACVVVTGCKTGGGESKALSTQAEHYDNANWKKMIECGGSQFKDVVIDMDMSGGDNPHMTRFQIVVKNKFSFEVLDNEAFDYGRIANESERIFQGQGITNTPASEISSFAKFVGFFQTSPVDSRGFIVKWVPYNNNHGGSGDTIVISAVNLNQPDCAGSLRDNNYPDACIVKSGGVPLQKQWSACKFVHN